MTIKEALKYAKELFEENDVEGKKASAEFLLRQTLKVDRSYLVAHSEENISILQQRKYKGWVKRRSKHEPVWYITGFINFYGQDLHVNQNVLIPRPETEVMLEKIIMKIQNTKDKIQKPLKVLDIGTGSGAIILTLANVLSCHPDREKRAEGSTGKLRDDSERYQYFASDLSEKALSVARKNAKRLGLHKLVKFKKGDLFGPWIGQKFDLIITNLPYIPHEDMSTLAFDLVHYEPRMALDGGPKGMEIYQRFFEELPTFVEPKAKIYCEIGDKQGPMALGMAQKSFPRAKIEVLSDYAEHDRVIIIET